MVWIRKDDKEENEPEFGFEGRKNYGREETQIKATLTTLPCLIVS